MTLRLVSRKGPGYPKNLAGVLLFKQATHENSMLSAAGFQVQPHCLLSANNHRLYNRYSCSRHCLTPEHAKVLLPHIIPKPLPENCSKIVLMTLFFGANDATIEGTRQHVSPSLTPLKKGPIGFICCQSSRDSDFSGRKATQSRHQITPYNTTPCLCVSLGRSRPRGRTRTSTNSRTYSYVFFPRKTSGRRLRDPVR